MNSRAISRCTSRLLTNHRNADFPVGVSGRLENRRYPHDSVGHLTNIDYATSSEVGFAHDPLNRVTTMVDAVGTTKYTYTAGGLLWTEDPPSPRLRHGRRPVGQ